MVTFLLVIALLVWLLLVACAAAQPARPAYRPLERDRRFKASALALSEKEAVALYPLLATARRLLCVLLLLSFMLVVSLALGWALGLTLTVFVALTYDVTARFGAVKNLTSFFARRYKNKVIAVVKKIAGLLMVLGASEQQESRWMHAEVKADSFEELLEIIKRSHHAVDAQKGHLLSAALQFDTLTVRAVMTPRSKVSSVEKTEFLGPLVLSELHSYGHRELLVTDGSLDKIVGVLRLDTLLSLDTKRSVTAEKAMTRTVVIVGANDSLRQSAQLLLDEKQQLAVVVDGDRMVGVVTLSDLVGQLINDNTIDSAGHGERGD